MWARVGWVSVVLFPGVAAATPLGPSPDWFREGTFEGEVFGQLLAIGDVDNDGFAEFVATSHTEHIVFSGTPEGLQNSVELAIPHEYPATSTALCDIDGDGHLDLISGEAPFDGSDVTFIVRQYFGGPLGIDPALAWETSATYVAFPGAGPDVACAGDLNADGIDDLLVGVMASTSGTMEWAGHVEVYLGTTWGLPATPNQILPGVQAAAFFGRKVAGVGDIDGDGFDDAVIGAPGYDNGQLNEGRAYLFRGRPIGLLNAPARVWDSNVEEGAMGIEIAGGNFNGDGYADVAIAAPGYTGGILSEGRAMIWTGSATGMVSAPAWTAEGNNEGALFGLGLAVGDRDDDGYDDLAVGGPFGYGGKGFIDVFMGGVDGLKPYPSEGVVGVGFSTLPEALGAELASGDVDGDGLDDLGAGALFYTQGAVNEGAAMVWLGDPEVVLPGALQGGPRSDASLSGEVMGCATVPSAPGWGGVLLLLGLARRRGRALGVVGCTLIGTTSAYAEAPLLPEREVVVINDVTIGDLTQTAVADVVAAVETALANASPIEVDVVGSLPVDIPDTIEVQDVSVLGDRFLFTDTASIPSSGNVDLEVAIPDGQRLVVEQVSARVDLPPSSDPVALWTVGWDDDDGSQFHYLPLFPQGQDIFVGGQSVDLVASGTLVVHIVGASGGVATVTASGHLVTAPE